MAKNVKQTSSRIATLASETLQNSQASQVAKSLAASALAQRNTDKQPSAKMEGMAAKVLSGEKYASVTKELAASVLAQANRQR
jgi:endonuclease III